MNKLTLSWLIKTIRPYSKNPHQAYQTILCHFLGALENIKEYPLECTSSSRIMNNEYDFPSLVRENFNALSETTKKERVNNSFNLILNPASIDNFNNIIKTDALSSNISTISKQLIEKETNTMNLYFQIVKIVIMTDNRIKLHKIIYEDGNKTINLISGNLLSFAFNKKPIKCNRIVVIPVDDDLSLKVEENGNTPLISADSLHGKWIKKMLSEGYSIDTILAKVEKVNNENELSFWKISHNKTEFYLVPISKLKERNKAESSTNTITKALSSIRKEYDISGQGRMLFIPLLGTGRSRTNITKLESIEYIKKEFLLKQIVYGNINIVVYTKDLENIGEVL